jgi:hypothetical protein
VDSRAKHVLTRYARLKADRANLEGVWQEIAELVRPMRADFNVQRQPGERRALQVFDGSPGVAAENLASGLWSMVTNSANEWFRLRHPDEDMNRRAEVALWLDQVTAIMRDTFSAGGHRFYAAALENYADLVVFGTAPFFVAEGAMPGRLMFSNRSVAECVIAESALEEVDTVIRRFTWTAAQAYERWGPRAGSAVLKCVDGGKEPDRRFVFLHAVEPDTEGRRNRPRWRSLHVAEETGEVVQEGYFHEFPYMVPRWSTATRGLYGDSPAMLSLPDIKTLQSMEKTQLIAAQKAADPPLLAADENALRSIRVTPGGITYGAVDQDGRVLVRPLDAGARFNLTIEMAEQKRQAIRMAFYGALLTMVATPGATATEVLARQEEQLRLMGPHLGRLTAEFHDPLIRRVFSVLWRSGQLPDPPLALLDAPELSVEYVSPLARAQRASEGAAIMRTLDAVQPLAAINPAVLDNFDLDEVSRGLAETLGLPSRMLRDPRRIARERQEREAAAAAQAQAAQLAAAAKPMSDAARGLREIVQAETMASGA